MSGISTAGAQVKCGGLGVGRPPEAQIRIPPKTRAHRPPSLPCDDPPPEAAHDTHYRRRPPSATKALDHAHTGPHTDLFQSQVPFGPGQLDVLHQRNEAAQGRGSGGHAAAVRGRTGRRAQGTACARGRGRALEGEGRQRRPQQRLGRRLEEVAKAVGGGYCRLQMPLRLALGVRGTVAGHRLGALEGGGGYLPLPMHPSGRGLPTPGPPPPALRHV